MNLYRVNFQRDKEADINNNHIITAHNYEDAEILAKKWVEGFGSIYLSISMVDASEILFERQKYKIILADLVEKINMSGISDDLKKDFQNTLDLLKYW